MSTVTHTRRDFLKLLGLATACTIIKPSFPAEAITPAAPVSAAVKRRWLKITGALLNDTQGLKACLDDFCQDLSCGDPNWETKTTITVATEADDFIRSSRTVLITYKP